MITLTHHEHGVAQIALDDGKANVLNLHSLGALEQQLGALADCGAVVLSGRRGTFSGGLDLKTLPGLPSDQLRESLELFASVTWKLLTFPRPVVAAVTGHAIAGGAVLLLACDRRVGESGEGRLGLSEVAIGMPLPRFVMELAELSLRRERLTEATLHGRVYGPKEALEVGYLTQVVDPEQAVTEALSQASQLARLPNPAYRMTKARRAESVEAALARFSEEMSYFLDSRDWAPRPPR